MTPMNAPNNAAFHTTPNVTSKLSIMPPYSLLQHEKSMNVMHYNI